MVQATDGTVSDRKISWQVKLSAPMSNLLKTMNPCGGRLDHVWRDGSFLVVSQCAIVGILFLLLYGTLLPGLMSDWYTNSIYSYGFFVPVVSCYFIWRKTAELKTIPIVSTLWGCAPLVMTVALYLFGQVVADTFVMRISMVLALVALTQMIFGNYYLKALAFPLFYLFFMIPFPYLLVKEAVNVLMFFDAAQSAKVLQILGIPIFLESNFLHLPNITLEVADVCSGISSVFALFVLGLAYAYCLPVPPMLKTLLVASTVPVAVLVNLFRIVVTSALAYRLGPIVLESYFHKLYGTFNFLLSVTLLVIMGEILRKACPTTRQRRHIDPQMPIRPGVNRSGWIAVATSAIILGTAIWVAGGLGGGAATVVQIGLERLPSSLGTYAVRTAAWTDQYKDLKAEETLTRVYSSMPDIPIEVFIGYRGSGGGRDRLQSPRLILPDKWNYIWIESSTIETSGAEQLEANWMLTQRGDAKRVVLYWYKSRGRTFSGELDYRLALLKARIQNDNSGIAVVRIATPVLHGERVEEAQERLKKFVIHVHSELGKIFPA